MCKDDGARERPRNAITEQGDPPTRDYHRDKRNEASTKGSEKERLGEHVILFRWDPVPPEHS